MVAAALKRSVSSPAGAAPTASLPSKQQQQQQQARVEWGDAGSMMSTSISSSMWPLSGSEDCSDDDQSDDDDEDDDVMLSCPATPTQTQLVPLRHRKSFSLSFASVDDVQFTMDNDDEQEQNNNNISTPSCIHFPVMEGPDGEESEDDEEHEEEEGAQSFVHVDAAERRIEFTFSPVSSCGSNNNHHTSSNVPDLMTVDDLDLDALLLNEEEDDEDDDDDDMLSCFDSDAELDDEEEEEEHNDSSPRAFTPFAVRHACEYREFDMSARVSHSLRRRNPNHRWKPFTAVVPIDSPLDFIESSNTSTSKAAVGAAAPLRLPPPQQQMCFTPVSIPPTPGGRGVFDESWHSYTTALLGYAAEQLTAEIQAQTIRAPSPIHIDDNNNNIFASIPERHHSPLPSGGEALVHAFNAIQESPRSSLGSASTPSTLVLPDQSDAYVDMEGTSYAIVNSSTPRVGASLLSRDLFGFDQPHEECLSSSSDGDPAKDESEWRRRININRRNKKIKKKNMSFGQMPSSPMVPPHESSSNTP